MTVMSPKTANDVIYKLGKPEIIDTIKDYADFRIEKLTELLYKTHEIGQIRALQGSIQELQILKNIRENAGNTLKEARK